MTTATSSDEALLARLLPVLRRIETPVSCVELSRQLKADSSAIYRICMNHPQIVNTKGKDLTTFAWRGA